MKIELIEILDKIKRAKIIYSRAGGGAGSVIMMEFEANEVLHVLFINTAWRIEKKHKIMATSSDDISPEKGLVSVAVSSLENTCILDVEVSPFFDLNLKLENSVYLRVFNVFSYTSNVEYNWSISIPSQNLSYDITNEFKIKKSSYY